MAKKSESRYAKYLKEKKEKFNVIKHYKKAVVNGRYDESRNKLIEQILSYSESCKMNIKLVIT